MKSPKIKTKRLILRELKIEDARIEAQLFNEPALIFGPMPYPYTEKDSLRWIKNSLQRKDSYDFAITLSGKFIGAVWLNHIDARSLKAEIGYGIGRKYWGRGYGTEAVQKVIEFAFNKLKLNRIYAVASPENKASLKILKKFGFKIEGKFRQDVRNRFTGMLEDRINLGLLRKDWKISV